MAATLYSKSNPFKQQMAFFSSSLVVLLFFPLFLISQNVLKKGEEKKVFSRLELGYKMGNAQENIFYGVNTSPDNFCGTEIQTIEGFKYFDMSVNSPALAWSRIHVSDQFIIQYGASAYWNSYTFKHIESEYETYHDNFAIHPFIKYEDNHLGIGLGLHMGKIDYFPFDYLHLSQIENYKETVKTSHFLPSFYGKLGYSPFLDVAYNRSYDMYTPSPVIMEVLSVGSRFGVDSKGSMRVGLSLRKHSNYKRYFTMIADYLLHDNIGIKISLESAAKENSKGQLNMRGMFALNYNFYKNKSASVH